MKAIKTLNINIGTFGLVLKLYPNGYKANKLEFRQLHQKDKGKIQYKKVCSMCGLEIEKEEVIKGFEISKNYIVPIENEIYEKCKQYADTNSFRVFGLGDSNNLDTRLIEDFYYVKPEQMFIQQYTLLKEGLKLTNKVLIGSMVMRTREKLSCLKVWGNNLILIVFKNPNLIKEFDEEIKETEIKNEYVKMMCEILKTLNTFNLIDYKDEFRENMKDIIQKKIKGEKIELPAVETPKPISNIEETLRQTLQIVKPKEKEKEKEIKVKK